MIAFDLQLHPLCELFPPMSQSELQALAKNTIFITIAFKEAVDFKDAFSHTSTLLRYLGILVGRQQNLLQLMLRTESDKEKPVLLEVYWSMPPETGAIPRAKAAPYGRAAGCR